jgi:hypothetical protein
MLAVLLIALFVWIAGSIGQVVLHRFAVLRLRPLERFVFSASVGLGIAAYGVLGLGLCGLLAFWPVAIWWLVLAVVGLQGMKTQLADIKSWLDRRSVPTSSATPKARGILAIACVFLLSLLGAISVVAAFQPPGPLAWDALAYHLADPKVFVLQHRLQVLPTDHHSNFPFTVEMLFAVGLLFNGYPLANLFHLALGVLTTLCILAVGERWFGRGAGYIGAVLFAGTPLVLWESSVAYIDVGFAFYTTLAVVAAVNAISCLCADNDKLVSIMTRAEEVDAPYSGSGAADRSANAWLALAGIAMGFALGIKYLALMPLALIALLLLYRRVGLGLVARYALIALVIGSPWYIKSAIMMRNPVYPFYLRVFPQTRYWSVGRETAYKSEQDRFGLAHSLGKPREAFLNLLETPWSLLTTGGKYFNQGEVTFSALIGGMYAAFGFVGLLLHRRERQIGDLAALAVSQVVVWFFLAQVGRYLIQIMPLFALLAGATAARLMRAESGKRFLLQRMVSGLVAILLVGNMVLILWSVTLLPSGGDKAIALSRETGLLPTALSLEDALNFALHPDERVAWLRKRLDVYDAQMWVNNQRTAPNAGVILYEETRGFYLDRPYLWGNDQHSSYIPYDQFQNGADVTTWMNSHGYRYAIINLNWSPHNPDHKHISDDEAEAKVREWYVDQPSRPGDWYRSVGDAIKSGLWTVVEISKGNVVLQIGPSAGDQNGGQKVSGSRWQRRQG